jgi:polar amino acid transport system substrate-binding protein
MMFPATGRWLTGIGRVLLAAAGLAIAAQGAQGRSLAQIEASGGRILIATEGTFPPFNVFKGAQLTGFEVELANLVVARMGLQAEWKAVEFNSLIPGLARDRWDIAVASHSITEERAKIVTFANPHYCSGGVIVATDPAVKTAKDLAGKVVAVQTGTMFQHFAQKVPGTRGIRSFQQDTEARSALITGHADAWITDRFTALELVRRLSNSSVRIGEFLYIDRLAAVVAKDNTPLVLAWNRALAQVQADGSYAALSQRYFGMDVRCK